LEKPYPQQQKEIILNPPPNDTTEKYVASPSPEKTLKMEEGFKWEMEFKIERKYRSLFYSRYYNKNKTLYIHLTT